MKASGLYAIFFMMLLLATPLMTSNFVESVFAQSDQAKEAKERAEERKEAREEQKEQREEQREKQREEREEAREKAQEMKEEMREAEQEAKEKMREAEREAKEEMREAEKEAKEKMREAEREAREEMREAQEELREREELQEFDDDTILEFSNGTPVEPSNGTPAVGMVTLCHIPPGNPAAAHTITVGSPAIRAHIAHGDVLDDCSEVDLEEFSSDRKLQIANKLKARSLEVSEKLRQQGLDISDRMQERALKISQKLQEKGFKLAQKELDSSMGSAGANIGSTIKEREVFSESKSAVIIDELRQKIERLENRVQSLLNKLEQGSYYSELSEQDTDQSYNVSFEGTTGDASLVGAVFLEDFARANNAATFKVTGGEIFAGDDSFDVVFGKARVAKGQDADTLNVLAQIMDQDGNVSTARLALSGDILGGISDSELSISKGSVADHRISGGTGTISQLE